MATKTDICNYALSLIGEQLVTNVENTDEGQHAIWANKLYNQTKNEVLRMHNWGCARKRIQLAAATAPEFGYTYAYELPADFIRIVSINDDNPDDVEQEIYEKVGSTIYSDEATLYLDYIHEVGDEVMDPLLVQVVYTLLAAKLAWAVQQNRTLREELSVQFKDALAEAKHQDSVEKKKPLANRRYDSKWIAARYTSTQG